MTSYDRIAKENTDQSLGHSGPIWTQHEVSAHFLEFASFDVSDFAYSGDIKELKINVLLF